MDLNKYNPFRKNAEEQLKQKFEQENKDKLLEVLSFIKELANDAVFEHDGRKKYHVRGTTPVNLLDHISRGLVGLSSGQVDSAREELLEIMQNVLMKAESTNDQDVERIKTIISLLNQQEIFSRPDVTRKFANEIKLFDHEPQITMTRRENPDPKLN